MVVQELDYIIFGKVCVKDVLTKTIPDMNIMD